LPDDIFLLADNLREIEAAALASCPLPASLVPNLSGTRVYFAAYGWGRVWKWFFVLLTYFAPSKFKEKKIHRALQKTETLCLDFFNTSSASAKSFRSYLLRKTVGSEIDERSFYRVKRDIITWNRITSSFQRLSRKCNCLPLFIAIYFPQLAPLMRSKRAQRLLRYQKLLDLEGCLRAPLPLHILTKLACAKKLNKKEELVIRRWNRVPDLNVRRLHSALKAFLRIFKKELFPKTADFSPKLLQLERNLLALDCEVFYQRDPLHIQWRSKLQPGDVLQYLSEKIVLGRQIGAKTDDNNLVFTLQGDDHRVVVIGINRAILGLKKQLTEKKGGCLHSAKCLGIVSSGRFAIYQRLHGSLNDYQWKTTGQQIHPQDLCMLIPVENMLHWMIEQKCSPQKFAVHHLMFDNNNTLKYSKTCLPEPFNYTLVEEFVFKLAKGNAAIFKHLMECSGVSSHPFRDYYAKMLDEALAENSPPLYGGVDEIDDPRVEDKGEEFYTQISKLQEACLKDLLIRYTCQSAKALKQEMCRVIRDYYYAKPLCAILWPTMQEEVKKAVIARMKLRKRVN